MIIDRLQKFALRRKYRDDLISQISAQRDAGQSIDSIAKSLDLRESTVRHIIKHFL